MVFSFFNFVEYMCVVWCLLLFVCVLCLFYACLCVLCGFVCCVVACLCVCLPFYPPGIVRVIESVPRPVRHSVDLGYEGIRMLSAVYMVSTVSLNNDSRVPQCSGC